ncbi:MAG: ATP phosphoribosyltransferase regulatory subunit [Pseudomonadales bacterium]
MADNRNWLLPEGVDELLPGQAWALECIRRATLDVFRSWGFEYIEPPLIEYLDALLVGSGNDLDLQTLKMVDQRSGRLLGVRADMSSQAARIDAHSLAGDGVQRLCYAGNVVYANPPGVLESRVPLKAGAEIFGAASLEADAEVITLLLEVLHRAGARAPVLVLGHMGIYRALVEPLLAHGVLGGAAEQTLFAAVQSKSQTDIAELLAAAAGPAAPAAALMVRLPTLMGRREVLAEARAALAGAPSGVDAALDDLERLAATVAARCPEVEVRFDLAELAGYGYHNGPVFAAFQADKGSAMARGGRYDGIGAAFGRARPATGFDVNLKQLLAGAGGPRRAIWVPWESCASTSARAHITTLRAAGEVVVCALSAAESVPADCDRILQPSGADWVVRPLS